MPASIGSSEPVANFRHDAADDFLTQHLGNLLVRQPSSARKESNDPPASSSVLNMSRRSTGPQRCPSIKQTPKRASVASPSNGLSSTLDLSSPSSASKGGNDIFDSFFKQRPAEPAHDTSNAQSRRSSKASSFASPQRYSAVSEPAHVSKDFRRRGPSSVSMSTTFGGSRGKVSRSGTDMASSDECSFTSQSSRSSDLVNQVQSQGSTDALKVAPGMLGDVRSVRYLSNETAITTPTVSEYSAGGTGKVATVEWNPAFMQQTLRVRRPSMTLSNTPSSFGGGNSSPPGSEPAGPGTSSPLPPAPPTSEQQTKALFDNGSAIEPPDATEDGPSLADRIRDQHINPAAIPTSGSDSARHMSMTTKRMPWKRTSPSVSTNFNDSLGSTDSKSLNRSISTQRGQGSDIDCSRTRRIHDFEAKAITGDSVIDSLRNAVPFTDNVVCGSENLKMIAPSRRKASVTLVPASDDGRTFRFVSAAE